LLKKLTFDLETGKTEIKTLVEDACVEFPVINMNYVGYKNRFVYMPKQMKTLPSDPKGHDNMFNDSLIKYDFENEKIMGQIDYGTAKTSGEVFF